MSLERKDFPSEEHSMKEKPLHQLESPSDEATYSLKNSFLSYSVSTEISSTVDGQDSSLTIEEPTHTEIKEPALPGEVNNAKEMIFSTVPTDQCGDEETSCISEKDSTLNSIITPQSGVEGTSTTLSDLTFIDPAICNTTDYPEQKEVAGVYLVIKKFVYQPQELLDILEHLKETTFTPYLGTAKLNPYRYHVSILPNTTIGEEEEVIEWDLPNTQQADFMDLTSNNQIKEDQKDIHDLVHRFQEGEEVFIPEDIKVSVMNLLYRSIQNRSYYGHLNPITEKDDLMELSSQSMKSHPPPPMKLPEMPIEADDFESMLMAQAASHAPPPHRALNPHVIYEQRVEQPLPPPINLLRDINNVGLPPPYRPPPIHIAHEHRTLPIPERMHRPVQPPLMMSREEYMYPRQMMMPRQKMPVRHRGMIPGEYPNEMRNMRSMVIPGELPGEDSREMLREEIPQELRRGRLPEGDLRRGEIPDEMRRRVGEEGMRRVGEEPMRRVNEEPMRRVGEEPMRRVGEEPMRRVNEEPMRRLPEEPIRRLPEEPIRRLPEEPMRRRAARKHPEKQRQPAKPTEPMNSTDPANANSKETMNMYHPMPVQMMPMQMAMPVQMMPRATPPSQPQPQVMGVMPIPQGMQPSLPIRMMPMQVQMPINFQTSNVNQPPKKEPSKLLSSINAKPFVPSYLKQATQEENNEQAQ